MSTTAKRWQAAAYMILSGGFLASAIAMLKDAKAEADGRPNGLGRVGPRTQRALTATSRRTQPAIGAPKQQLHDVQTIEQRVELIRKLIKKGSMSSQLHEKVTEMLAQKCDPQGRILPPSAQGANLKYCVAEKDCWGEVEWIFNQIRHPGSKYAVRYTRDMILADTFTAPERTMLKKHGGDCDDYVILMGSMLMSVGHPVRIRVIQTKDKSSWSHVYLITPKYFPDDPKYNEKTSWAAIDASVDKPAGWEAPGAPETARTGKPHGIVARVKDFPMPMEED